MALAPARAEQGCHEHRVTGSYPPGLTGTIGDTLGVRADGRENHERGESEGLQLPSHGDQRA